MKITLHTPGILAHIPRPCMYQKTASHLISIIPEILSITKRRGVLYIVTEKNISTLKASHFLLIGLVFRRYQ
jgi:hypothetical protein